MCWASRGPRASGGRRSTASGAPWGQPSAVPHPHGPAHDVPRGRPHANRVPRVYTQDSAESSTRVGSRSNITHCVEFPIRGALEK
eukprot:5707065-Pyramimonas_sp.AAC.1